MLPPWRAMALLAASLTLVPASVDLHRIPVHSGPLKSLAPAPEDPTNTWIALETGFRYAIRSKMICSINTTGPQAALLGRARWRGSLFAISGAVCPTIPLRSPFSFSNLAASPKRREKYGEPENLVCSRKRQLFHEHAGAFKGGFSRPSSLLLLLRSPDPLPCLQPRAHPHRLFRPLPRADSEVGVQTRNWAIPAVETMNETGYWRAETAPCGQECKPSISVYRPPMRPRYRPGHSKRPGDVSENHYLEPPDDENGQSLYGPLSLSYYGNMDVPLSILLLQNALFTSVSRIAKGTK